MSAGPPGPPPGSPPPAPSTPGYPGEPFYAPGWTTPPPPAQRRRRTKVVVVVVAGVVLLALVAWGAARLNLWAQTRPAGVIDSPREVNAQQVGVGHCIETLPDDGEVAPVRLVPCGLPHEAEVVGAIELATPWPGQEQVDQRVAQSCVIDTAQRELGMVAVVWSPTVESWRQGDRTGLCLARSVDGTVTGSFSQGETVEPG